MRKDVVVIGASAGGIDALRGLCGALPGRFAASVFVVVHTAAESPGVLAAILDRAGPLPAVAVEQRIRFRPAAVYVAPPDHHIVIAPGVVRPTRGPKENRFRPAIDPLFRSAAQTYGPRVIGVILTGGLDDGTAGLWTVKQLGGTAIVQDPAEALVDSMPRNALQHVRVDHCVRLADIAPLLVQLSSETIEAQGGYVVPERVQIEVDIAKEKAAVDAGVQKLGAPSNYACPECHGVLLQLDEGGRVRFRCHTGHAYSAEALLSELDESVESALWSSVRTLEEKRLLIEHLAEHARRSNDAATVAALLERSRQAHERAEQLRRALLKRDKA
ncbi:MAG TPA: chemotaxis protein CheB [Burkholderiaceae bacterium]|nr:chemotaxis protein CheB [Burkholderiaceae bacterium]